jgi:iron complex outermembrane recepter protein
MKFIATLAAFLLSFTHLFSQNVLKGKVKDAETNEDLIGAAVVIKDTKIGTVTDFDGNFSLTFSQALPVTLVVSYLGYITQETEVKSTTKTFLVRLEPDIKNMDEVVISEMRITEKQKQAPLTVETLDPIAIKETPAANFYEGLSHLKGVDLTSASIGFKIINTRGFNSTSPVRSLQLIDGSDNQAPGLNFSLGNFLGASELDILKVDLIVGASGAYYGPNAFNGVINMSTKNPFQFPGLSVQAKVGERNLVENAVRFAQVFKNKKGEEKFAYKFNFFFMRADDWKAQNYDATPQSNTPYGNPGGWDAVNTYGDESYGTGQQSSPGLGTYHRTGYNEDDIVDYNTKNIKTGLAAHYKITKDVEAIYTFNFGTGTTVYQGDNRFSLRDILFFQNKAEIRKENKFFFRVYATHENAGNSYDAFRTALIMQNNSKEDTKWNLDYANYWNQNIDKRVRALPGFPPFQSGDTTLAARRQEFVKNNYYDSFVKWHQETSEFADTKNYFNTPRYEPGTPQYDSALQATTSRKVTEGGSRFYDRSALYHVQGEYKFTPKFALITIGGSSRLYRPYSAGTIFIDTGGRRISNFEYGVYAGAEKKFWDEKLKVNATLRMDKNQNFNYLFSPAVSVVYAKKDHVFRFSFSSAIRNPTLTDQYFYLNVGRATLVGNLEGYKNLVTTESFLTYLNSLNKAHLQYFDVAAVKPERVRSAEVGYRVTLGKKAFIDASYYYSIYKDFLGYKIGIDLEIDSNTNFPTKSNVYRVTTNSKDIVTTTGFSIGLNYFFKSYLNFVGNYSWNVLDRHNSTDPIIPAFNTPANKFNIGFNGREIHSKIGNVRIRNWGYGVNYRWVQGFRFEGSPQFTGDVPTYYMLDVQMNYNVARIFTTFKLGANNLTNNKVIQVYGGPKIGRLVYFSATVDLPHWH